MAIEKKETKKATPQPVVKKAGRPKKVNTEIEEKSDTPENTRELPENVPVVSEGNLSDTNTRKALATKSKEYRVSLSDPSKVLNVRTGAGKEYPVVSQLKEGTPVVVSEEKNGFGKISEGHWVMLEKLK